MTKHYLIFDLAILISLVALTQRLLPFVYSGERQNPLLVAPAECPSVGDVNYDDKKNRTIAEGGGDHRRPIEWVDGSVGTAASDEKKKNLHRGSTASSSRGGGTTELRRRAAAAAPPRDSSDGDNDGVVPGHYFRSGQLVELYGDKSTFAAPAIVTGYDFHPATYDLHNAITDQKPMGVLAEFVHPYRVYKAGTEAHCNLGGPSPSQIYMVPCTVVSHRTKRGSGFVSYRVSYYYADNNNSGGTEEPVREERDMPFSRVQRVRVKAS